MTSFRIVEGFPLLAARSDNLEPHSRPVDLGGSVAVPHPSQPIRSRPVPYRTPAAEFLEEVAATWMRLSALLPHCFSWHGLRAPARSWRKLILPSRTNQIWTQNESLPRTGAYSPRTGAARERRPSGQASPRSEPTAARPSAHPRSDLS
jgi:hypothetical protein